MPRRFQLSLARSLIAVALLCAGFACHRQALPPGYRFPWRPAPAQVIYNSTIWEPVYAAPWEAAFGVCLALAAGVMAKRTVPFVAGAIMAVLPLLWFIRGLYY